MADATILRMRRHRWLDGFRLEGVAAFPTTASTCTIPLRDLQAKIRNVSGQMLGSLTAPTLTAYHSAALSASIAATSAFTFRLPRAATITAIGFDTATSVTQSDTNYWTFGVLNKTQTLTVVDGTAAANSTKTTGGAAITGYTQFPLTLSGTAANLAVVANDLYELTLTKASAATTMTEDSLTVTYTYTGPQDEVLYLPSPNASGYFDQSSGKITFGRNGTSLTSAGKFRFEIEIGP